MTEPYTVRRASPEDAAAIIRLVDDVAAQEEWLGIDRFPLSMEQEVQFLAAADSSIYLSLVCTGEAGSVVGVLTASRGTDTRLAHVSRLALAVSPTHRRHGIGRHLLDGMEEWGRSQGVRRSTLSVLASNEAAIALFQSFGFREEGRFTGQYRLQHGFVDEIWMVKWLQGEVHAGV